MKSHGKGCEERAAREKRAGRHGSYGLLPSPLPIFIAGLEDDGFAIGGIGIALLGRTLREIGEEGIVAHKTGEIRTATLQTYTPTAAHGISIHQREMNARGKTVSDGVEENIVG